MTPLLVQPDDAHGALRTAGTGEADSVSFSRCFIMFLVPNILPAEGNHVYKSVLGVRLVTDVSLSVHVSVIT